MRQNNVNIKNSEIDLCEKFIFIGILILFLFRFFWGDRGNLENLFIIVILIKLLYSYKIEINRSILVILILNLIIIYFNIIINGINGGGVYRLYNIYKGLIYIIFISKLYRYKKQSLIYFLINDVYIFLNIYYFINIPLIIYQINTANHYDEIGGFTGPINGGTHIQLFVWILLIGVSIIKYRINKKKLTFNILIFEILIMAIISSFNDNTSFYILGVYFIILFSNVNLKKILKFKQIVILILTFIILICGYIRIPSVKTFVTNRVVKSISGIVLKNEYNESKDERSRVVKYAIDNNGLKFGNGFNIRHRNHFGIGKEFNYSPKHLTMNTTATLIYESGIVYLIAYILLNISLFRIKNLRVNFIILITTVLLMQYIKFIDFQAISYMYSIIIYLYIISNIEIKFKNI